ncbi:MarR family winged helix-turn-helix transcriptional regulator [Micromonospora parathelypteridis]|uniref:DNA-binding MarR family transcriptional regulator n=1 Tax=Micromonospora parathelypteridis TaxID=1839617 RepID=A0A840VHR1_9ACTN|nr:MarR family winged helix-turn-helix transcriptional regulator [Micromonospora parathelypteridis]MBB5476175.1 DNA-binding MarR family transcriptional regulator [Micromonospora parathelypteridis]GGO13789.1 MarR family transcriptional regulator [Micromonospora parathelypteridis]
MDDDRIAEIVGQWSRERPDLDPSPLLIIGRIQQIAAVLDAALRPPFAAADLGNGDFDVLAALRREGEPYTLTAGQLSQRMLVTTGAVTKRVDRLIAHGLVSRSVSAADARGRVVGLTPAGAALTDRLIEEHLANEAAILGGLSDSDRRTFERLLAAMTRTLASGDFQPEGMTHPEAPTQR